MHYLKKNILTLIAIAILITIGVLFIFINPVFLINVLMYSVAILLTIIAIRFIITSHHYLGKDKIILIFQSIVLILFSVLLFIVPDYISRLIIGIILLFIPIVELVFTNNKIEQLKKDIWKYVIGIIFILSFNLVLKIVFVSLGIAIIAFAGYLIYLLILHKKDNQNIFVILFLKKIIRKDENDIWQL